MKKQKEPSIIRQFFNILIERYKTRKALRLLVKQEWSVDFLTAMLIRASKVEGRPLEMTILNKSGHGIKVNTIDTPNVAAYNDDSIFNHLDDELRVKQFINGLNR